MDVLKLRFMATLTVSFVLMVCGACGPSEEATEGPPAPEPSESESAGGNQPPAISSLTPAQTQVSPSSIIEVRCVASDPEGDALSYEWAATGGSFSGTGSTVSWLAPEPCGDWDITITVKDGKGGITQSTIVVSVVSNQEPVIASVTANPATVLPGASSTVTCVASDPDGDALTYTWKADYGEMTGVGETVTWMAPDTEGEFHITVTVVDGKGGVNVGTVSVTAERFETQTTTFTPLASETGTMSSGGDKDLTRTVAGDSKDNEGYRAFWSFDLYSLRGTDVKEATITFTTKDVVDDPFRVPTGLRGLHIWHIRGEAGELPDYLSEPVRELTDPILWEPPDVIDVTTIATNIARGLAGSDRLQLMAGFQYKTNANALAEYVEWLSVTVTVTYAPK